MEEIGIESKDASLESQIAIRCAKAAILLSALKRSPNHLSDSTTDQQEGKLLLKIEVEDLKIELLKERVKNKRLKLCSLMDFSLQIALLLSLWTVCLKITVQLL